MDCLNREFRDLCSRFVTGVAVVTFDDGENGISGLTVNSFTSLSLDPPLVLVCIAYSSARYRALSQAQKVAFNILTQDQAELANLFASPEHLKPAPDCWTQGEDGAPVLVDSLATFECEIQQEVPGGDHAILIARVEKASANSDEQKQPLIFYRGRLEGKNTP